MTVKYHEVGNTASTPINIGGSKQVFEAPTRKIALVKEGFSFTDLALAKLENGWDAGIVAKNIVILPELNDAPEAANIEAVYKEGRYSKPKLKDGQEGWNYKVPCSIKTYEAIKSYEESGYTRFFQITSDGEVSCDVHSDGKIKGRELSSFTVGARVGSTDEDTGFCMVGVVYENDTYSIIKPDFDVVEKEAIYDVQFVVSSATSTEIKGSLVDRATGFKITSLASGDLVVKDGVSTHASTFTAADSDGVYTLTGDAFVTGFTVGTNGVVSQVGTNYESSIATAITV